MIIYQWQKKYLLWMAIVENDANEIWKKIGEK